MNFSRTLLSTTLTLAILPALPALAQTPATADSTVASPSTMPPIDKTLPFGSTGLGLPVGNTINSTTPRTVELLAGELKRENVPMQRRAELISELAMTQLPSALPAVLSAAGDPSPLIRATVAAAIGSLVEHAKDSTAASEALVRLTSDGDASVRASAMRAAGALGRNDLITAGLNDADASVVAAALAVASADSSTGIVAKLTSDDRAIFVLATEAAARNNVASTADAIARRLGAEDVTIPELITGASALGTLKATSHATIVEGLLKHDHPSVRRAAVAALFGVNTTQNAQQRGIAMLADPDESVRATAANLLAKVPGPQTVGPLVKALSDPYVPLHDEARHALVAAANDAIPAAVELLNDSNARRREDGSYILGQLKSRDGYAQHVELLKDTDWLVAGQVAKSLGQIGGDSSVAGPALVAMFARAIGPSGVKDDKGGIPLADAATNALLSGAQLGYAPTGDAGKHTIRQKLTMPGNVRSAAIWAIGIVGCTNPEPVFSSFRGMIADIEDGADVKIEALKAVGNLKFKPGAGLLTSLGMMESSPEIAALAHWSKDRLSGNVTPYTAPNISWEADVSITDLKR